MPKPPRASVGKTSTQIDNDQARRYDVASQMTHSPHITSVEPAAGIPGGEVRVHLNLSRITAESLSRLSVRFSEAEAHLVTISSSRALVLVPDGIVDGPVRVATSEDESG